MNEFFQELIAILEQNPIINLQRGGLYHYLGDSNTNINRVLFNGIKYRISPFQNKVVTIQLLWETYCYYQNNNSTFPSTDWYLDNGFGMELQSRPCNKSVARALILTYLNNQ